LRVEITDEEGNQDLVQKTINKTSLKMASEKFCLRWNDFESNISTAFRELRDDKDFFDVTLSCDDEQIQAHKVILSACSPFFRGVLRRNPHAHPLLYLKGVKFSDLTAVLNFMYHGEVNVAQEELNSFLAVAEELRVKGLTQNNQSGNNSSSSSKKEPFSAAPRPQAAAPRLPDPVPPPKKPRPAAAPTYATHDDDDIQEVMPTVKTEPLQAAAAAPEPYQQQEQGGQLQQVDDGMGYDEEGYEDYGQYGAEGGYEGTLVDADGNKGSDDKQLYEYIVKDPAGGPLCNKCTICGKTGNDRSNLRKHVENAHFNGVFSYECKYCPSIFGTRTKLNHHVTSAHRGFNSF